MNHSPHTDQVTISRDQPDHHTKHINSDTFVYFALINGQIHSPVFNLYISVPRDENRAKCSLRDRSRVVKVIHIELFILQDELPILYKNYGNSNCESKSLLKNVAPNFTTDEYYQNRTTIAEAMFQALSVRTMRSKGRELFCFK